MQFLLFCVLFFVGPFIYGTDTIIYDNDYGNTYRKVLEASMAADRYEYNGQQQAILEYFPDAAAVEAFDFQADAYADAREPSYWYPQYKAPLSLPLIGTGTRGP
jgi:hypothetical protein